jgi:hypothetical protein
MLGGTQSHEEIELLKNLSIEPAYSAKPTSFVSRMPACPAHMASPRNSKMHLIGLLATLQRRGTIGCPIPPFSVVDTVQGLAGPPICLAPVRYRLRSRRARPPPLAAA